MTADTRIAVAVAIIRNAAGEILVSRRAANQHMGGRLEFPGGKIESGESTEAALARELEEELGIRVAPADISGTWMALSFDYSEKHVFLDIRQVRHFEGEPEGREGQPLYWLRPVDMRAEDFPDANEAIVAHLKASDIAPTSDEPEQSGLTHLNERGEAAMVDVSSKQVTERVAVAEAVVRMLPETLAMIVEGRHKKGDVFAVCRVAGIQAAKRTAELIPLCHSLNLSKVRLDLEPGHDGASVRIRALCKLDAKTGVEMEALTAASVAALTLYDMCKAVDKGMEISRVRLLEKRGGRSGTWLATPEE